MEHIVLNITIPEATTLATVIMASRKLEGMLEEYFNAEGTGLHEKLNSVQDNFSEELKKRIRKIASIRNNVVHNDNHRPVDKDKFIYDFRKAATELLNHPSAKVAHKINGVYERFMNPSRQNPMDYERFSSTCYVKTKQPKSSLMNHEQLSSSTNTIRKNSSESTKDKENTEYFSRHHIDHKASKILLDNRDIRREKINKAIAQGNIGLIKKIFTSVRRENIFQILKKSK